MNKQEIIDNLRLEISNKDLMIIDLTFKNKDLKEIVANLQSCENCCNWISEDRGGCKKWPKQCKGSPTFEMWMFG